MMALVVAELRQRIRGKRWWVLLALWVFVLWGFVGLVRTGARHELSFSPDISVGAVMFGSLALFVLGLACLIVPSLTSTSINTERDRGTLAVLQATLLRPGEIVIAKFIAGTVIALGFLAATVPLTIWCSTEGGVEVGRTLAVYLILVIMSALMLVVGLAASALIRRPALSAVAAYLMVFLLAAGTPILFGLSLLSAPESPRSFEREIGWRWVILAPNPFVILADAAPRSSVPTFSDPLEGIRDAVRGARRPPRELPGFHEEPLEIDPFELEQREPEPPALWPWGLAIDGGLALLGFSLARGRLRVPARRLAPGERVA